MKKILLLGGVAILAYTYKDKLFGSSASGGTTTPQPESSDIFVKYNNRIVADATGKWMLIKDGKIYGPNGQASLDNWYAANPGKDVIMAPEDIWVYYAQNNPSVFANTTF